MRPSPLLGRPGAVANPVGDPDAPVPAHFGRPLPEQGALAGGRALSALARDVVAVTGPDRLTWLTSLSSQVLTGLLPGDGGVETLLMDAQGHVSHALAALDDGERALLVTEAGRGADLTAFLESMRFMLRVEVTSEEGIAVLGAMGGAIGELERAARAVPRSGAGTAGAGAPEAGAPEAATPEVGTPDAGTTPADAGEGTGSLVGVWRDPWPGVVEGGTAYDVGLERPHPGRDYRAGYVLVDADRVTAVVAAFLAGAGVPAEPADPSERARALGSPVPVAPDRPTPVAPRSVAGSLAWEALRAEAGRPRWAREVDERTIPPEVDWLRTAVHLTKGCYPGQETIARTLNLGRPPRRLTVLQLDGLVGELPRPGDAVLMGARRVGAVTTVARHYELGPIALAMLRRAVPADAPLLVEVTGQSDGEEPAGAASVVDAAQEPLVSPEGRAQASPTERPGAALRQSLLH